MARRWRVREEPVGEVRHHTCEPIELSFVEDNWAGCPWGGRRGIAAIGAGVGAVVVIRGVVWSGGLVAVASGIIAVGVGVGVGETLKQQSEIICISITFAAADVFGGRTGWRACRRWCYVRRSAAWA